MLRGVRFSIAFLALATLLTACRSSAPAAPRATSCARGRTVIVVRHAERESKEKDSPLSEKGEARARTIAAILAPAGVTRVIATPYKRTQQTLAPLAERLSLPIEQHDAARTAEIVARLRAEPDGAVTVVASHSNAIPELIEALAGAKLRDVPGHGLAENDYARIIVVHEPCADKPSVLELSSGE